jgi:purine-binding chemotaxis protein CheW
MQIPIPPHFDPERSRLTTGLYRVGKLLVPALDIDAIFDFTK